MQRFAVHKCKKFPFLPGPQTKTITPAFCSTTAPGFVSPPPPTAARELPRLEDDFCPAERGSLFTHGTTRHKSRRELAPRTLLCTGGELAELSVQIKPGSELLTERTREMGPSPRPLSRLKLPPLWATPRPTHRPERTRGLRGLAGESASGGGGGDRVEGWSEKGKGVMGLGHSEVSAVCVGGGGVGV